MFRAKSPSGQTLILNLLPAEPGPLRYVLIKTPTVGEALAVPQSKVREIVGDAEVVLYTLHEHAEAA